MKKTILFLIIFLITLISLDIHATSFKFVWENTLVEVPFGDSVEKYKDIPVAHLYVDNKLAEDAKITYNRDGDWLRYLKDVDSTQLKDYYVWYKAYENDLYCPGTCVDYKCLVQFKIVDNDKPVIKILNDELTISSNVISFDPLSNVSIFDNCDKEIEIEYSPKFEEFKNGLNTIKIYAKDKAGNEAEASYNVNVVDQTIPYILKTKTDDLVFDLGSKPNLEGYFEAYDDLDGNITNKINYPTIKTDKIGEYTYDLTVIDSSGNKTTETINVTIKDLTIPEIELSKETDILNYKVDINNFNFLRYVKKITDNENINYNYLTYETNLENKVGTYYVRFKYDDGTNFVYKDLILKLVSFDKPNIDTSSIKVLVGSFIDLKDYVKVTDPSDPNILTSVIIDDDNVNYYKEGNYLASIYAINSSGISTEEKVEVKVLNKNDYAKYMNSGEVNFNTNDYIIYIMASSIVVILVAFVVFIIVLKKKKKI